MTKITTQHNKNYTIINNSICKDKRLSYKAKGIFLYAFHRPDDWSFHINDLVNQSTDGIDSVRSGLKELEEAGYLKILRKRRADGRMEKSEWFLTETPSTPIYEPQTDFPNVDNSDVDNPTLLSTDVLNTEKELLPDKEKAPTAVVVSSYLKILDSLNLSDSCKKKISKDYTPEQIELAVKRTLAWTARKSDEQGIFTTLDREKTWKDNPSGNQFEETNKKYLGKINHLDGKEIGNTLITIGHKYVEFVCGLKTVIYKIEESDFVQKVRKYLEYLMGLQRKTT